MNHDEKLILCSFLIEVLKIDPLIFLNVILPSCSINTFHDCWKLSIEMRIIVEMYVDLLYEQYFSFNTIYFIINEENDNILRIFTFNLHKEKKCNLNWVL